MDCVKEASPIRSREEASAQLKLLAEKTATLGCVAAERNRKEVRFTNSLNRRYASKIKTLTDDIAAGEKLLQDWAETNRKAEFGEAKTLEFTAGKLHFRKCPASIVCLARWDDDKVLAKLIAYGPTSQWAEYIRRKPSIDRAKLLKETGLEGKLPAALLSQVGLRRAEDDKFSIEYNPDVTSPDVPIP